MREEMQTVKDHVQEVSVQNKDPTASWTCGHVNYALAENMPIFCFYYKNLWSPEIKGSGLIKLDKKISRHPLS